MGLPRLAIVGTGVAGLSCAYLLKDAFSLTLFEQNATLGGHTHTIDVAGDEGTVSFDTGFMVFNKVTYPCLTRFFEELKVPIQPTDMSFSVQHVASGLEYCGSGWNTLFAQRSNLVRPSYYRLLWQVNRFNQEAVAALDDSRWQQMTVGDYVEQRGYGAAFLHQYLLPMSSAVWSAPPGKMLEFPAITLLRFFHNHGFLGLHTQHPWWTVTGGARQYIRRLLPELKATIRSACPVHRVTRMNEGGGVEIEFGDGGRERFDRVILAGHADQSLGILADADTEERQVLGTFKYQKNLATVHTDPSSMPKQRRAWASWNYRVEPKKESQNDSRSRGEHMEQDDRLSEGTADLGERCQTIYWMNRLQGLSGKTPYFVSINGENSGLIAEDKVVRRITYTHPVFTLDALSAQVRLPALNRKSPDQPVLFCGSYFRYGFHEDAFQSGVQLARILLNRSIYSDVLPG
jgi:predicted NAD/FAD-binding protein